ncbi:MAG: hypothetical protein FJ117_16765 [Deltaproteobacteria bacterium]|nr:hypothetical protein [Deltaproteobacteria bacterium]
MILHNLFSLEKGTHPLRERRRIMKTEWYDSMIKTLQLNGKGESTQEAYARALRMLVEFYGKSPDLISEEELQDYFL